MQIHQRPGLATNRCLSWVLCICILGIGTIGFCDERGSDLDPTSYSYLWGETRVKLEVDSSRIALYQPDATRTLDAIQQQLAELGLITTQEAIEQTPYPGLYLIETAPQKAAEALVILDHLATGWASPCLDFRGRLHIPRAEILATLDGDDPASYTRVLAQQDLHLIQELPSVSPLLHLSFDGPPRLVEARIRRLLEVDGVVAASPNFIMHLAPMAVPNDPFFGAQWHLENTGQAGNVGIDIDAASAWGIQTGSLGVRISIIDEGVDVFHEDLAAHIVAGHDSTNQASPAGVAGNCATTDGHGTACAGLAAGIGDNSIGISGVAWSAEIQPVRLGFGNHWTENAWIIDAITWAASDPNDATTPGGGGDILSNSWGGGAPSAAEQASLQYALEVGRDGMGCVLVFASGNDNAGVSWPAAYPEAIAVGASSPCDERKSPSSCDGEDWWGSNFGPEQTIVAPGVLMATTDITGAGGYVTTGTTSNYVGNFNGTSSATPVTAGALAIVLAQDGTLTAAQVRTLLETSSDDEVGPPAQDTPGFDNNFGHGRLNLANMLALMGGPTAPSSVTCSEEVIGVQVSWTNGEAYDQLRVSRDGTLLATLAGSATGYLDLSVPIGQHIWEVQGLTGGAPSLSGSCNLFLLGAIRDLVWAPETGTTDSGTALVNALVASGRSVVTAGSIFALPDLDRLDRIWVQLGMFPNNHVLTAAESDVLDAFLTNGVGGNALFMEGGDTWFFDTQTTVHGRFGITALSDGASVDNLGQVLGATAGGCDLSGLSFAYIGENSWVDRLSANAGAFVVQSNETPVYDVSVFQSAGGFFTLGSAFELGGLSEATSTHLQLVEAIIACLGETLSGPTNLSCSAAGNTATISWTNPGGWDSVELSVDGAAPQVLAGSSTGTTISGLASGSHTVEVVAVVGVDSTPAVACTFGVDPSAPSGLACQSQGFDVALSWTNTETYESIEVLRGGQVVATLAASATSHVDPAPGGGVHQYFVQGIVGGFNSSPASCGVIIDPLPVTALSCARVGDTVNLAWTNSELYDSISLLRAGVLIQTLTGTATSTTDVPGAGIQSYVVRATISSVNSGDVACSAAVPPAAPIAFSCDAASGVSTLQWTNGAAYNQLSVTRDGVQITLLAGNATSFTDNPGSGQFLYGISGSLGGVSSSETTCTATSAPDPVTALDCSQSAGTVSIFWSEGAGIDGVEIERDGVLVATVAPLTGFFQESGVTPGTRLYSLRTTSGALSSPVNSCQVILPPGSVTALTCVSNQPLTAQLDWTSPAGATSITILRDGVLLDTVDAATTSYLDAAAPAGIPIYTLSGAVDGVSGPTASCGVAVDAPAPPPVASFSTSVTSGIVPLNVAFTDSSTGSIDSWAWTFGDGGSSTLQSPTHLYESAGSFTAVLQLTGPGGTDSASILITVDEPAPIADFSGTPTSGTHPLTVAFNDLSGGGPSTSWAWDFGDGSSSTGQNPGHTYLAAGSYAVTLTATGPGGSDTLTRGGYITVAEPAPIADFSGTPTSGIHPLTVAFTDLSAGGPSTSWAWNFGDGSSSTSQNPGHTYLAAGSYAVTLTATGPGGSDTLTRGGYITVAEPAPIADFSGTPTSGTVGMTVAFSDLSSGGPASGWSWNFGDGTTSTLQNPSHSYPTAGSYDVSLTVSGPGGSDALTRTGYITVAELAPIADFSGTPTSGTVGMTVTFSDLSSGGPASGWSWNFGDGTTSTLQNPGHNYPTAGSYDVSLTVSGPGGSDTLTRTGYITVAELAPIADFSGTPTSGTQPLTVAFTDLSGGGPITSWLWDFGDASTSSLQNPSHIYTVAASYEVSLTVTGPGGVSTLTRTGYIEVVELPQFIRGDGNQDGILDISDPVLGLEFLFGSGSVDCLSALDVNDDSAVNLADIVFGLGSVFGSNSAPSAPYPACGSDPTADALGCLVSVNCP